jgi:hypothetical protein
MYSGTARCSTSADGPTRRSVRRIARPVAGCLAPQVLLGAAGFRSCRSTKPFDRGAASPNPRPVGIALHVPGVRRPQPAEASGRTARRGRESDDQQGRDQLAETPRRDEGQLNQNPGVSRSVGRNCERFDVSTESSRELTCSAGKTKLPLPSTIQADAAPLANMNLAPLSASSRVP